MKAIKMVSGLTAKDYEGRLKELGMTTLEERRKEMDLTQAYKIVNQVDRINSKDWFVKSVNRGTRGTTGLDIMVKQRSVHD